MQCDSDGIIISWNRVGVEITGFSADDLEGYHFDSILTEESRRQLDEMLAVGVTGTVLPGTSLRQAPCP
jgi:PAS domain S-box-containing protein